MENYEISETELEDINTDISDRPIEVITEEIKFYKQTAGAAILEIGRRLCEAKSLLNHGEWCEWLRSEVDFSEVTAQRFMRISKEYRNPSPVTDLGVSKALLLLALPASERDDFIEEKHVVNGEEKRVNEMSKRELETVIREKNEALEREKKANEKISELEQNLKEISEAGHETESKLNDALSELEELKNTPADISDEIREEIKAETAKDNEKKIEQLNKKIEKLRTEKQNAESKRDDILKEIVDIKNKHENELISERAKQESLKKTIDELTNKLMVSSSAEITEFKVYFEDAQSSINKMSEKINALAEQNPEESERLKNVLIALCDTVKSAFE